MESSATIAEECLDKSVCGPRNSECFGMQIMAELHRGEWLSRFSQKWWSGEALSERCVSSGQSTCTRPSPPPTLCKPGVTYSITLSFIRCDSSSPIKSGALNKCFLSAEFIWRVNGRLSPPERFSFLEFLRCLLFHHGWRSKMVVRAGGGGYRNVKSTGISLLGPKKKEKKIQQ